MTRTKIRLGDSCFCLSPASSAARMRYERVVRNILRRYLLEDRGLWRGSQYRVPRFLQNDVARYWRTMAVDFAYKLRNRSGKGWAIRNLKLRMSRKLIYVSGLLACFRCHLDSRSSELAEIFSDPTRHIELVEHMRNIFAATPLEITAGILLRYSHLTGAAEKDLRFVRQICRDTCRQGEKGAP